jgi:hypothetical protein
MASFCRGYRSVMAIEPSAAMRDEARAAGITIRLLVLAA